MQGKFENHAEATQYWASLVIQGKDAGLKVEDVCNCSECSTVVDVKKEVIMGCFASLSKQPTIGFTSECICSRCKNVTKR